MNVIEIDRIEVPELSVFARLTEAQLRSRLEPEKGVFIAESLKVVKVALEHGVVPVSFLAERKFIDSQLRGLLDSHQDVPVYTADRNVLAGLTGYELSRGVLCAMRRPVLPTVEELCHSARRIAVIDSVVNATNTGAIFRAAAALGIDAILLTSTCCDPLNRRSVRVSMGTVFQLPWTFVDEAAMPADELMHYLHNEGFVSVALALSEKAVAVDDPVLQGHSRVAVVLGSEGYGLDNKTIEACDYVARIPMQRGVDSLNVAAAAAVAFWQLR